MIEIFQFLPADVFGAITTPVAFRSDSLSDDRYGSLWIGDHGLDIFFACLIRNQAKCYLVFLGIICMEVLLFNNLHECMGCIGAVKICVLIIIKKCWQRKVERERFSPYQSEDPSRFELFCLYQNAYNGKHKNKYSIYRYIELYQRKFLDLIIHTM